MAWWHASGSKQIWRGFLTKKCLPVFQNALWAIKYMQEGRAKEPEIPVVRKDGTCLGKIQQGTELNGDGFHNWHFLGRNKHTFYWPFDHSIHVFTFHPSPYEIFFLSPGSQYHQAAQMTVACDGMWPKCISQSIDTITLNNSLIGTTGRKSCYHHTLQSCRADGTFLHPSPGWRVSSIIRWSPCLCLSLSGMAV